MMVKEFESVPTLLDHDIPDGTLSIVRGITQHLLSFLNPRKMLMS